VTRFLSLLFLQLPYSAIFLISPLDSRVCVRQLWFSYICPLLFLSTEFSSSAGFTFLTHTLSLPHPSFPRAPLSVSALPNLSSCRASLLMNRRDGPFPAAWCSRCFILVLLGCWEGGAEQLLRGWRRGSCWVQPGSVEAALLGAGCELGFVGGS